MGTQIKRFNGTDAFPEGDGSRYAFDFKLCSSINGWAQIDTSQDASYYGNWANPTTRTLTSYCEGDVTVTICDTDAEFVQAVTELVTWHKEHGYWRGIDGMCKPEIIGAFERLGLGEFLH
jgi:hypothetical protein